MKYFIWIFLSSLILGACAPKKPPLTSTQIVDGKSIVVPPEFDVLPEVQEKGEVK